MNGTVAFFIFVDFLLTLENLLAVLESENASGRSMCSRFSCKIGGIHSRQPLQLLLLLRYLLNFINCFSSVLVEEIISSA